MGYAQLFQGMLMFPNKEAFETALAVIEKGEEVEDDAGERETFRKSLVGDRVMVLHYDIYQPATMWFETKGRLYVLAEYAVRGYLVAAYFGDGIELEVIGAALKAIDNERPGDPIDLKDDFFPMYAGARYDFETRFEGEISSLWWTVRPVAETERGNFYRFPLEDDDFGYNDYLSGDEFLSAGNRLFVPAQHQGAGSMETLPDANLQLIADASSPVGTVWMTHIPGNEHMQVYKHLGFEDVATPFAFYSSCLKLQLNQRFLETWENKYHNPDELAATFTDHLSYLYFAKGAGLVKVGYPDGEIVLKDFHMDASTAPPPPRRPSQDTQEPDKSYTPKITSIKPPTPTKKPWWKFW